MTWVVSTNTNTCHIYLYQRKSKKLTLLKEISHPELRKKTGDFLTSDRTGHYQTGMAHGAYSPHTDPKASAIDDFSRDIAKELNLGRKTSAYENLILITPDHMQGLLMQHLDKHVKEHIINTIPKDLMHLKEHELLEYLQTHTQFHDPS